MASSRFWERAESSEDDDNDARSATSSGSSDSSSSSSESDAGNGNSKFLVGSDSSEDEDDKRVVRSAKDRRGAELKSICDEIRNKMHIHDWAAIQSLFEKLNKQLEKTMKSVAGISFSGYSTPRPYLRLLGEIQDFAAKSWEDKIAKKKMSPTNARAMTTMRQRLKKHIASFNTELDSFREHPESSSEEEGQANEESSGDESIQQTVEEAAEAAFERFQSRQEKKRDKLLTMDVNDIDYLTVSNKIMELVSTRGRKGVDRAEQAEMMEFLVKVSKGPLQQLEVLMHLVSALMDINPSMTTHMPVHLWKSCVATLFQVLHVLKANPHITIDETHDDEGEERRTEEPPIGQPVKLWGNLVSNMERLDDELFKSLQVIDPHTHKFLQRVGDDELFLVLAQQVSEYLERIGDMRALSRIALRRIEHLYFKSDAVYNAMRSHIMIQQAGIQDKKTVQHHDVDAQDEQGDFGDEEDGEMIAVSKAPMVSIPVDLVMEDSVQSLVTKLTKLIYDHGDERSKARASICSTYMQCIHNNFYPARDMLLMSHLQDNVQQMDVSTQILHNRAIGQLGLCAFRAGLISEAHACLSELYSSGRVKELLAQGMSRWQERTPELEKVERRRQMPFHMHINLELLEACHLICAMLLEIPNIAAATLDSKRRVISKHFRRLLDNYNRQTFTGPPENVRDHVMAASKALSRGDWSSAYSFLFALPVWGLVPAHEQVLAMLQERVKTESVRTYLFAYGLHYSSVSLGQLSVAFQLPSIQIHSVVSKMMVEEGLAASWDQPTCSIVMRNAQPSRLQALASDLSEKTAGLVDLNERSLQLRTGASRDEEDTGVGHFGEGGPRGGRGRGRGKGRGFMPPLNDRDGSRGVRGGRGGRAGGRFNAQFGFVSGYARVSDFERGSSSLTSLGAGGRQ